VAREGSDPVASPRGSSLGTIKKANDSLEDTRRKLEALSSRDVRRSKFETVLGAEQNKLASIAHRLARLV
jgi:hypothetical protein